MLRQVIARQLTPASGITGQYQHGLKSQDECHTVSFHTNVKRGHGHKDKSDQHFQLMGSGEEQEGGGWMKLIRRCLYCK